MNAKPRRRLAIVWLLFVVLLSGIVLHETTDMFHIAPRTRTGRIPMFQFSESDLSRVEITEQNRAATLIRNAAGVWIHHDKGHAHVHGKTAPGHLPSQPHQAHSHRIDPEGSARIGEQLALVARMRADRRVTPDRGLDHYGLDSPQVILTFYGREATVQPLARLEVGDLLPTTYAYYTRREGDAELSLVPRYYIAFIVALAFGEDQVSPPLPTRKRS